MLSDTLRHSQILSDTLRYCQILARCYQVLSDTVRCCQMLSDTIESRAIDTIDVMAADSTGSASDHGPGGDGPRLVDR